MKHFMFLTSSLSLNPYVSDSTQMVSICQNVSKRKFVNQNPDLWIELSARRDMSSFESYSLSVLPNLKIRGAFEWSRLKPAVFDTLFVDTVSANEVDFLVQSWNKAKPHRSMPSFVSMPSFIYWEKL